MNQACHFEPAPATAQLANVPGPALDASGTTAAAAAVLAGSFLTLHYRLAARDGATIVDTFGGKPATLTLGAGALAPWMEQCLLTMSEGERRRFEGGPGEAFGERNADMVQRVATSLLHEWGDADATYRIGDVVQLPAPQGRGTGTFTGMVREVGDGWLTIDFNHPLAGQAVTFEARIIGVL